MRRTCDKQTGLTDRNSLRLHLVSFRGFSFQSRSITLLHSISVYETLNFILAGYYACSCGDTWASELGVLSTEQPRLITTLRPVRRGSNGGVTLLGTAASILGGLFMGLVFCAASALSPAGGSLTMSTPQWTLVPMGLAAGIFGSLTDSILGATLQFTGFNPKTQKITSKSGEGIVRISGFALLDNNAVNFVSATLTALLFAFVARVVFVGM